MRSLRLKLGGKRVPRNVSCSATSAMVRVIIVPGNGGGDVRSANWYSWLEKQLDKAGHEPVLRNMPDPYTAR